jgi:hypothetical protein
MIKEIGYIIRHKIAFLKIEKKLTGKISLAGLLHDLDKIFLHMLFLSEDTIRKIHRENSSHHVENRKNKIDYIQMIIDCECARYTKPDKPLNAYETFSKYYPEHLEKAMPYFIKLNLNKLSDFS